MGNFFSNVMSALPVVGSIYNTEQQRQANRDNWHNQQTMFGAQTELANSAHQREVKDLQAAGLNPILSAGGGGSATPSGGTSTMNAPQIDMPSIMQANQFDVTARQNQERINIDKANSAASIVKNLNDAELARVKTLTEREGALGRYLGTDRAKTLNQKFREFGSGINHLLMKQPQPSSGGNLP